MARRLRVLHLIDHMGSGGAQRVVAELAEGRRAACGPSVENRLAVASLRSHCLPGLRERLDACGASYREFGLSRTNPVPLHRVVGAVRELRPDVLHTHLEFSNEIGALVARSMGRHRPRVIVHVHNYPDRHYSRAHRWAGRALARWTDAYIVPSPSVGESTRAAFGPGVRRLEVVPYGIDPAWFDRGPSEKSAALREGADPVIGTVARLVPQKSVHDLVAAMPTVLAAEPGARLLIFGDGPLRADLEAQSLDLEVSQAVTFAGFAHDVASAYGALDVFVLPSRHEGLPICLLEVMAMGIPVVGTRVPGITDLVENERTGLSVPHGDPDALGGAVLRLLGDATLRDRLRSEARNRVERTYSRAAVAVRTEALYDDLASTGD